MSFSTITRDPSWGISGTQPCLTSATYPEARALNTATHQLADLGAVLRLAAVDTSGINKPLAGWITYSGGGGGSTRPTTGMIYPRGQ